MKKPESSAKKQGLAAKVARPFELMSSVESALSDNGGCITWQGYRVRGSKKKPAHWPDFYLATLMRNDAGLKASVYDLVSIGGQSPWHKIKYTVLSHGASVTFVVKGKITVVGPGESFEVPVYEDGDELRLREIRFKGDVLFLRAEPVVEDKLGKTWPPKTPVVPPPPYPGGGKTGAN